MSKIKYAEAMVVDQANNTRRAMDYMASPEINVEFISVDEDWQKMDETALNRLVPMEFSTRLSNECGVEVRRTTFRGKFAVKWFAENGRTLASALPKYMHACLKTTDKAVERKLVSSGAWVGKAGHLYLRDLCTTQKAISSIAALEQ